MAEYKIHPKFSLGERVKYKTRTISTKEEIVEGEIHSILLYLSNNNEEYSYVLKSPGNKIKGGIFDEHELIKIDHE